MSASQSHVVLGVSGSIAAYKALDIASKLTQAGRTVRVVMTAAAMRFVAPLSFEAITHQPVLSDLWTDAAALSIAHVQLGSEAAVIAVAPATAQVLASLAHGLADDALTSTILASRSPLILAPAMNSNMWLHPATRANVALLRQRGALLVGPDDGYLAEGTSGPGRLADPTSIVQAILAAAQRTTSLQGVHFVVTAGPTREAIDPVRFLTNASSGKMGYAVAEAARDRGARVTLVSGPVALAPPPGMDIVQVVSAQELLDAVQRTVTPRCVLIMAAAISDYRPQERATHKLKRAAEETSLTLVPTPDILKTLRRPEGMRVVAFAAETRDLLEHARTKLLAKGADMLVANDVLEAGAGFDVDTNHVWLLKPETEPVEVPLGPKRQVAEAILDQLFG
jgi:phosphopantothenoylcysteine decarboxylase/phosphopantothenate--cysteine ligase